MPKWGQTLMSASCVPISEESIVSAEQKMLTTYCRAISYKSLMPTTEKVIYWVEDVDYGKPITTCLGMFSISNRAGGRIVELIERFDIQQWLNNVVKKQSGTEQVLEEMYLEEDKKALVTTLADPHLNAKLAFTGHLFVAEKRWMLKEALSAMGEKAKARLKQPIDQAKEKYKNTRDSAQEKYGKMIDSSMGRYKKMRDSSKEKYGKTRDNSKENYGKTRDGADDKYEKLSEDVKRRYENARNGAQERLETIRDNVKEKYKKMKDDSEKMPSDATKTLKKNQDYAKEKYEQTIDLAEIKKKFGKISDGAIK